MKDVEIYENVSRVSLYEGIKFKNCVPVPSDEDYENGFVKRYFCKRKEGNLEIIEIDKEQYEEWNGNESSFNGLCYDFIEIDWKIRGRIRDLVGSNGELKEPGIADSNFRTLKMAERKMPGLAAKLKVKLKEGVDGGDNLHYLTYFGKEEKK